MNDGKILIIDDDERFSNYLKQELNIKGYSASLAISTSRGLQSLRDGNFDLVIVGCGVSDIGLRKVIAEIKRIDTDCIIVIILEEGSAYILKELSGLNVYEFIVKPINLEKLSLIVKKGIELHSFLVNQRRFTKIVEEQNVNLKKQNAFLNRRVEELSRNLTHLYENLRTTYMRTIKALAQAIDARDHYTHSHSENVSIYATKIAEAMHLPIQDIEMIRQACELHDIGKIGIHDRILSKEAKLTDTEQEQIKLHSLKGAQILEPLNFLGRVIEFVCEHHEHYDGSGYPYGHKGDEIPLGARIIHVADAYDAMVSARSYRKIPLSKKEAIAEIKRKSGSQFDPRAVEAFLKIVNEL